MDNYRIFQIKGDYVAFISCRNLASAMAFFDDWNKDVLTDDLAEILTKNKIHGKILVDLKPVERFKPFRFIEIEFSYNQFDFKNIKIVNLTNQQRKNTTIVREI